MRCETHDTEIRGGMCEGCFMEEDARAMGSAEKMADRQRVRYDPNDIPPPRLIPEPEVEAIKHDSGKVPMSLLDRKALESIAEVLAFGAEKYSAHNWRAGFDHTRLSDAALRHIFAWIDGEDADPESGLSHIAHAQCCLMFLQRLIIEKPERDDRYKEKAK